MNIANDAVFVVARRWDNSTPPEGGSVEHCCVHCGHLVLTDSVATPLIRNGAVAVCRECFVEPSGHSVEEFERDIEDAGVVGTFIDADQV